MTRAERNRKYRMENREKIAEYQRKYYMENREGLAEAQRKYYIASPEKVNEANRKWKAKNPEKVAGYRRKWQVVNREKIAEYNRKYLMKKYGLTEKTYEELLNSQDGVCAICKRENSDNFIDHDHKTQKTRGILCNNCNIMLGGSRDTIHVLEEAISYLEKHNEIY